MHRFIPHETIEGLSQCSVCGYWRYEIDRYGTDPRVQVGELVSDGRRYVVGKGSKYCIEDYKNYHSRQKPLKGYFYAPKLDAVEIDGVFYHRWTVAHVYCPAPARNY